MDIVCCVLIHRGKDAPRISIVCPSIYTAVGGIRAHQTNGQIGCLRSESPLRAAADRLCVKCFAGAKNERIKIKGCYPDRDRRLERLEFGLVGVHVVSHYGFSAPINISLREWKETLSIAYVVVNNLVKRPLDCQRSPGSRRELPKPLVLELKIA